MDWRFGLITAHAKTDWHARRLSRALSEVGTVETLDPSQIRLICGRAGRRDVLTVLAAGHDARRFDVVLLGRIAGPRADAEVQLDGARALELVGVPCLNRVGPMLAAQDKLWTAGLLAAAGIPTPLCSSVPTPRDVVIATAEIGQGVAKPIFGSLGEGMFRCVGPRERTRLSRAVRNDAFLLQRFVPPGGADYRLFVVGDRVEACIRREAPAGEWRSNVSRGGRVVAAVAHRLWRDIAVAATQAVGLELAGIDLAVGDDGPMVLEVNGFPNFRGVYQATGRDMSIAIAARMLRMAKSQKRRVPGRLRASG